MEIYSLEEVINDKTLPPSPIIGDGILLPQTLLLITGLPKAKKSMLAANLVIAIASGKSFSFFKIEKPYKVLALSAEGGYFPNRDRFKTICSAINFSGDGNVKVCFDSRIKLEDDNDYEELEDILEDFKPEVLVLDPLVKFHHKDENSAQEMGIILERLRNIIEDHKLAIILVHHLGKSPQNGARGSSAILGEYDSSLTLTRIKDSNKVKVDFELRHAEAPSTKTILFNPIDFWFGLEENEFVKILKDHGSLPKKDWVDLSLELGLYKDDSGAYKRIDKELELGSVVLNTDGTYALKSE